MEPLNLMSQKSELLGYFYFQHQLVNWDNDGTANLQHQKSELLGYFTFNNSTLDNDGTAQPAAPEKQTVGILLLSTIQLVLWDNDGTAQPAAPEK
jgi:hypothetical protein